MQIQEMGTNLQENEILTYISNRKNICISSLQLA